MSNRSRGIEPDLLVSQVKNTAPYLFESTVSFPPLKTFREPLKPELSHFEYFRLCLSAHYLTVATPVPTDVDNQIRQKLWPKDLANETAFQMAQLILESRHWDFSLVTRRIEHGLSGHLGEWFTVAAGAYCALTKAKDKRLQECRRNLFEAIDQVTEHHSEVFGKLMREKQGLDCLKVSAPIAHNFGDLDRVMEMWNLEPFDPLKLRFYKIAVKPFDADRKLRHQGRLWVAGELYKSPIMGSSMAAENHRHFALRKPKSLRRSPDLMIQTGPFLDTWGKIVATELQGSPSDRAEVIEALTEGTRRLPGTHGYQRALMGMGEKTPAPQLSAEEFEKTWNDAALYWMDEIPSKA